MPAFSWALLQSSFFNCLHCKIRLGRR
jgi:hypothetical protein